MHTLTKEADLERMKATHTRFAASRHGMCDKRAHEWCAPLISAAVRHSLPVRGRMLTPVMRIVGYGRTCGHRSGSGD